MYFSVQPIITLLRFDRSKKTYSPVFSLSLLFLIINLCLQCPRRTIAHFVIDSLRCTRGEIESICATNFTSLSCYHRTKKKEETIHTYTHRSNRCAYMCICILVERREGEKKKKDGCILINYKPYQAKRCHCKSFLCSPFFPHI